MAAQEAVSARSAVAEEADLPSTGGPTKLLYSILAYYSNYYSSTFFLISRLHFSFQRNFYYFVVRCKTYDDTSQPLWRPHTQVKACPYPCP